MSISPVEGPHSMPQQNIERNEAREERLENKRSEQSRAIEEKRLEDQKRVADDQRDRDLKRADKVRGQNLDVTA